MEEDFKEEASKHRIRLGKTLVINLCLLTLGLCESVTGPTLIDLSEILDTTIESISFSIVISSVGSLIGCFVASFLFDKFLSRRYLLLFVFGFVFGVTIMITPFTGYFWIFCVVAFIKGWGNGALDSGCNVSILDIWQGHKDTGIWMHSIHFSFGLGAFTGPVLSRFFVGTRRGTTNRDVDSNIRILYPLLGFTAVLTASGFLFFVISKKKKLNKTSSSSASEYAVSSRREEINVVKGKAYYALIVSMALFLYMYCGCEVGFGIYIAVYCVKSRLNLSKKRGADITSIFWACFATMRCVSIFAAAKLKPSTFMILSFFTCFIGYAILIPFGEESVLTLGVGVVFMGFGMATMFATSLLWLESNITITNKIGAFLIISGSLGADTFPVIIGHLITEYPMWLFYLCFIITVLSVVFFILSSIFAGMLQTPSDEIELRSD